MSAGVNKLDGINAHIYPSDFQFESRIERITTALKSEGIFQAVWMFGVTGPGLPIRETRPSGVVLYRVGRRTNNRRIFSKIWAFIVFYVSVYNALRGQTVGCINAHSLSVLPLAYLVKIRHGCRLVYDTHELETESQASKGLRRYIAKRVEGFFVRKADKVFCVSDLISDWYAHKYSIARPTTILNSANFSSNEPGNYFRVKYFLSDKDRIFVYVGLFSADRGIEQLIETFEGETSIDNVVIFIGFGPLEGLIRSSESFGRRIFIHSPVFEDELGAILSSADFGICLVIPSCLSYDYCMPNKLLQYMASGLPVIVSPCTSLREFVLSQSVGVVSKGLGSRELKQAICDITVMDGPRLRQQVRETSLRLSWDSQKRQLISDYRDFLP